MGNYKDVIEELNVIEENIGIYGIISEYKKVIYIGQSINLKQRISNHISLLKHNNHYNDGFQEKYSIIGGNFVEGVVLCNCAVSLLRTYEKLYIDLFKDKGYTVYGDNITNKKDSGEFTKMENLNDEELGLSMLDDRYIIILHEYSKEKINKLNFGKKEGQFTNFLICELEDGIKKYNMKRPFGSEYYIFSKIMKEDVNYVSRTMNYIAYSIILDIKNNIRSIVNSPFFKKSLTEFENDYNYRRTYVDNILYRIKNNYDMNNDLIKLSITYSRYCSEIIDNNDFDNVMKVSSESDINIKNAFDFLYCYILFIYTKKIVIERY